jgi:Ca2+-binding RTX toxin-like protein/predicted lipoprotein with Yx(FWY)xxD motif
MKKLHLNGRRVLTVAVLVLAAAAALAPGAAAANHRGAVVKSGQSSLGRIIVDSHGKTLYLWAHDRRSKSSCYGKCAKVWPPLTTRGRPRAVAGARRALLGSTRRIGGRMQVTYRGHPLYYFAGDRRPGQTAGAGLTGFGGRWDPVSVTGTAVRRRPVMSRFKRPKLKRGTLTIAGTKASEKIALRLKAGNPAIIEVDVGDNGSANFSFKRNQVARIAVDARAGDDLVRIDESNGAFTPDIPTTIAGGAGIDNLLGGSGAETLLGGDGNDSLDGNGGNDRALLGAGDDTFVWDPGDGSDVVEGEAGADTMRFNGANIAEQVDLSANGNRLRFLRTQANITMDTAGVERVDFNALGGADQVTVNDLAGTDVGSVNVDLASALGGAAGDGQVDRVVVNGTAGNDAIEVSGNASAVAVSGLRASVSIQHQEPSDELVVDGRGGSDTISAGTLAAQAITLTLVGDAGDDTLAGGQGIETLVGGDGNDSIDGNGGNDVALMGAGDDTFVWDPGDGSDVVEGEAGADTMRFNGANMAEQVDLSANGNRLRFFRTQANITMDTAGVERVDFNALGGPDTVTVNELTGTDVTSVNADLAAAGGAGDGQPDRVVVNGTNGDDKINVSGDAAGVKVSGLTATVGILHPEVANDRLEVNTLAGRDSVDASGLAAGTIQLVVDGGAGDDTLAGGQGIETLVGGDGNDSLDGNGGNDRALLGAGDDTFVWDPGDGSDVVEGEAGADTMRFNGANIAEQVDLSANGNRLRFFRTQANITMDTAGVERVDFNALGGADVVIVGNLAGTDVGSVNVDLAGTLGGVAGDGQIDRVIVEGTNDGDRIHINEDASGINVAGLRALVAIRHQEATDALAVDGVDGNDDISAAGLPAQAIALILAAGEGDDEIFAGQGDDRLVGGSGNDTLDGSKGNDLALMGAGDDTFEWDPGDGSDTVEGEAGDDSMLFIGANIAERIDVTANGNRVRFVRDVGTVTMDTAGLERIDFQALGGADLVNVGDLTGTDLTSLQVDLEGVPGAGDGERDRVVVTGTNGDDAIDVSGDSDVVKVSGLAPTLKILHPEFANDRLEINTLDGIDTVGTEGLEPGAIQLLVDGVPVP